MKPTDLLWPLFLMLVLAGLIWVQKRRDAGGKYAGLKLPHGWDADASMRDTFRE